MIKKGTIRKITIKDFVTYSNVVLRPGPNLNIVIGPNGTGKSTVVAAIILGLGGSTKTIGRGTKVSEYVRHECSKAKIHIELQGETPSETFDVSREFNVNNESKWYINERLCSEAKVKSLMSKLNIQVDNLCQFLPQDRVQDFAKMNKKELLNNTQVAVGRQDLVEKHEKLIALQVEQTLLAKQMEGTNKKIELAEQENKRLEGRVQNLNEKKELVEQINHMNRKMLWLNYDEHFDSAADIKRDLSKSAEIMDKHKKRFQPLQNKISTLTNQSSNLQNKLVHAIKIFKETEIKINLCSEQLENLESKQREVISETNIKLKALQQRQNEIDTMDAKIDKLVNDERDIISKHGDEKSLLERVEKLAEKCSGYSMNVDQIEKKQVPCMSRMRELNHQISNLESSLNELDNVKMKRLEMLRRRDKDAYEAVHWLKNNRQLFQGQVYDPIMIELNVLNQAHSKYLENIIAMRDRVAFTCERRDDMNLLLRTVRNEMRLNINVLHSGPEHPGLATYKPPVPVERLRQFGLFAYTSSLISGPEPITKYLCRMYRLHSIPIGDATTYKKASLVPSEIRLFFSEKNRFSVNTSRYTGEKSTRIGDIKSDGTFSICVDVSNVNKIKKDLDELKRRTYELQAQCDELTNEKQKLETKRIEMLSERQRLKHINGQLVQVREKIASAREAKRIFLQNQPSEDDIKNAAACKIKGFMNIYMAKHGKLINALSAYDKSAIDENLIQIEINAIKEKLTHLDNESTDLRRAYENSKKEHDKIENVFREAEKQVSEALSKAKLASDRCTRDEPGFKKFKAVYQSLPTNIHKLQGKLEELQTKVSCMLTADSGELKAYENGKMLIAHCEAELETRRPKIKDIVKRRTALYSEWIHPLEELVRKINKNFSKFYEEMGCAGEVELSKQGGDTEFSDYGLVIRVTYRSQDPLQELNRFVQSGGERAVATAVFMLSLQDLTAAPFRCVDEINQGMDPQNERRIFKILVASTSKPDTGQYFLITPKLIPSLDFGSRIKVHIVHNGQHCEAGKEYQINSINMGDGNS